MDFAIRVLDAVVQTTIGFVIGRVALDFLLRNKDNFFYQLVCKPTSWLFNLIGRLVPKANYIVIVLLSLAALFVLRILLNQLYIGLFGLPAN